MWLWIVEFSKSTITFNNWIGFALYWVPMYMCVICYFYRTTVNYQRDRVERTAASKANVYYAPTDNVGIVVWRAVVSFIPILNLLALIFDLSPELFSRFYNFISMVLNKPLVPRFKKDR